MRLEIKKLLALAIFLLCTSNAIANPITHQISLKAVFLLNTAWNEANVNAEIQKANKIFSQCGVQIKKINVIGLNYTPTSLDYEDVIKLSQFLVASKIRSLKQPTLIFADKPAGEILFEGGAGSGGFAMPKARVQTMQNSDRKFYENLAVINSTVLTDSYISKRDVDYSATAHELGHVLLNQGHVDFPNLMATLPAPVNAELTDEQCETIRSSPLVK